MTRSTMFPPQLKRAGLVLALIFLGGCQAMPDDPPNDLAQWYVGRHVNDLRKDIGKGHAERTQEGMTKVQWDIGDGAIHCHVTAVHNRLGRIEVIQAEQEGGDSQHCARAFGVATPRSNRSDTWTSSRR